MHSDPGDTHIDSAAGSAEPSAGKTTRTGTPLQTRGENAASPPTDKAKDAPETGGFRIREKLGQGGMGVVWAAEQVSPRRRVALKVVRSGQLVDEEELKMFKREADALARLEHPNIAAIYESGLTDDGQHFFAMELVEGQTLNHYLAGRQNNSRTEIRHRLKLLRELCSAVHYAHQRGVIHRDLKPSNVIVTPADITDPSGSLQSEPQIKILDFGLARITDTDLEAASMVTEVGVIKGTLPYMSPEQAKGDPRAIDTRTDVYALGVMLYEMIAGRRPYEVARNSIVEALRVINEEQPRPLREVMPGTYRIDRDLETIVAKALEKDPDRRYGSAAALAEDIERFLTSQPILARPPSATYQLRKLMQRHRLPATLILMSLVAVIGFGVAMAMLYRQSQENLQRALSAETLASQEAETATQVASFLETLFRESNPRTASGQDLTARDMLEAGATRVQDELRDYPIVQTRLMQVMGQAFRDVGQYDQGTVLLEQAMQQARTTPGFSPERIEEIRDDLLYHYTLAGNHAASIPILEEILDDKRATLRADDPALAWAINALSFGELRSRTHSDESIERQREAVNIERAAFTEPTHNLSMYLMNLGWLLRLRGQPREATQHLEESHAIHQSIHGDDRPSEGWILQHLGWARIGLEAYGEAEAAFSAAVALNSRLFDGVHPELAFNLEGLAIATYYQGNVERAIALQQQAIDMQIKAAGEDHSELAARRNTMVYLMSEKRLFAEAATVIDEAIELVQRTQSDTSPDLIVLWANRSEISWNRGLFEEALDNAFRARELVASQQDRVVPMRRIWTDLLYAKALTRAGQFESAEPILRAMMTSIDDGSVPANFAGLTEHLLADGLVKSGRGEEGVMLARKSLSKVTQALGDTHWHAGFAHSSLGAALSLDGNRKQAEEHFAKARELLELHQPIGDIERFFDAERHLAHARRGASSAKIQAAKDRLAAERAAIPD